MEAEHLLYQALALLKQAAPLVPMELEAKINALLEHVEKMKQPQSYFT